MTTNEVIERLRYGGLRVRTALWLLSVAQLGQLSDQAARLVIHLVDVRQPLLSTLAPDQRFLRLSAKEFITALDTLCHNDQLGDCLLVTNCDLILAGLSSQERKGAWETLYREFVHRPRALLIPMPRDAAPLLPTELQLDNWRKEGRLVP